MTPSSERNSLSNRKRGYIMHNHLSWRDKSSASLPTTVPSHALISGEFTCVVWRIDIDAFHLARVVRQKRLQGFEVVPLHEQIASVGVAYRFRTVAMNEPIGYVAMVVQHRLLPDPIQCGHRSTSAVARTLGL